jgi:predicted RNA-binding Zn ribbon-like protein
VPVVPYASGPARRRLLPERAASSSTCRRLNQLLELNETALQVPVAGRHVSAHHFEDALQRVLTRCALSCSRWRSSTIGAGTPRAPPEQYTTPYGSNEDLLLGLEASRQRTGGAHQGDAAALAGPIRVTCFWARKVHGRRAS